MCTTHGMCTAAVKQRFLCNDLQLNTVLIVDTSQQLQSDAVPASWMPLGVFSISQLPKLCVKISILRHRRMWVGSFSTRLTSVTFAEDKVLIFLILHKNAKIVQL